MLAGFDASLVERLTKEAALAMRLFAWTGMHYPHDVHHPHRGKLLEKPPDLHAHFPEFTADATAAGMVCRSAQLCSQCCEAGGWVQL